MDEKEIKNYLLTLNGIICVVIPIGGLIYNIWHGRAHKEENKRFYAMEQKAYAAPTTTPEDIEKYKTHELYYSDFKEKDTVMHCVEEKRNQDIYDLLACLNARQKIQYRGKK